MKTFGELDEIQSLENDSVLAANNPTDTMSNKIKFVNLKSQILNGVPTSKNDIGLGNVENTGDSNIPSENGTEKFTTGGAYTLKEDIDKAYKTDDISETDLEDTDYIPFYDNSTTSKKKTLWSNIKSKLKTYFDALYAKVHITSPQNGDMLVYNSTDDKWENKQVSYTASDVGAIPATQKGANNGVAELDSTGKVPSSQLPSFVDDVLEYTSISEFPTTGETGKIYVDTTTNKTYRWSGTAYVEISPSLALGETSSTAYRGDRGKTAYDHSQIASGNPHNVTKSDVGLGNVGNFKAVSTVASQGLSNTEKSNARANIGAGTSSLALGTSSSTAFRGDYGNSAYAHAVTNKGAAFSSGLYKITTNSEGHVTAATAVAKADITGLGIPGSDTNTHRPIQVNGTEVLGNNTTALNLKAGSNVSVTNSSGTVTIAATDTTYGVVSSSANGLAPKVTDTSKYLKGDGTWATPTNTKNTAGSTDTSSKIFLIGATSQAANPQTYSHDTAYVGTDGCLYSGGSKVLTAHDGNNRKSFYGTCSTAAATKDKVVTLSESAGWPGLVAGLIVGVKFTNTNTYSNATASPITLNVNSTGAKNIWYGSTHSGAGNTGTNTTAYGRASYINYYMYDGTYWVWLSSSTDNNTNTTYSIKEYTDTPANLAAFVQGTATGSITAHFRFKDTNNVLTLGAQWIRGYMQYQNAYGAVYQVDGKGFCTTQDQKTYLVTISGKDTFSVTKQVFRKPTGDAVEANVLSGKTFSNGSSDGLTGSMTNNGAVTKTLDTSTTSYTIPAGYHNGSGKVSITTETKTATPSTSSQSITPSSGKVLSKVTVNAISTQTKTTTSSTSAQTVSPDSGKYLSSVTVNAITPQRSGSDIAAGNGKCWTYTNRLYCGIDYGWYPASSFGGMSNISERYIPFANIANAVGVNANTVRAGQTILGVTGANHSATYTLPAGTSGTVDLGAANTYRYVNTNKKIKLKITGSIAGSTTYYKVEIYYVDDNDNQVGSSILYYNNTSVFMSKTITV